MKCVRFIAVVKIWKLFTEAFRKWAAPLKSMMADILGITRQAVNIRVKKNQLLAFKQNGDFMFPVFQFTDKGLRPGFKDIMDAFDENTHPVLRLEVFKAPIAVSDEQTKTPVRS
jgi:hypothetical protein